jgi:hypothetical protein
MRALIFIAIAACAPLPEPQGPRVVCGGTIVANSNVAAMSSNCEAIPADRCWNDDSEECAADAEHRREHNARISQQRTIAGVIIVAIGVIAVGYAASN